MIEVDPNRYFVKLAGRLDQVETIRGVPCPKCKKPKAGIVFFLHIGPDGKDKSGFAQCSDCKTTWNLTLDEWPRSRTLAFWQAASAEA
jgi:hypothetical protein